MGVFPAPEGTRTLEVLKLAPLDVSPVLEFPAHTERAHAHSKRSARAVVNALRRYDNFDWFPRRREPFQCARLGVPLENFFCRRFDSRSPNENITHGD